jgi:ubiquinone/menaquinone biosynthesis C-methylase UbiE
MNGKNERGGLVEQYKSPTNLEARIALHRRFSVSKKRWAEWVFDQFEILSQSSILELGCGVGNLWLLNREWIGEGWSVVLGDFSQGMIEEVRRNLAGIACDFRFAVMDAGEIPFGDGRFDVVIANHMLYHVADVPRTLEEIWRVLRPGGVVYASTNGVEHMAELESLTPEGLPFQPVGEVIGKFTLQNGGEQIERLFEEVELRRHEDGLVVTEVRPLVEYALSRISIFAGETPISHQIRQEFMEQVAQKMAYSGGAIRITKDSGIFIGRK